MITPVQATLLVELRGKYKNFQATEERFGTTKNRGIVRAIAEDIKDKCDKLHISVGDMVYFAKYEDSTPCDIDGKEGTLIALKEIKGVSSDGPDA